MPLLKIAHTNKSFGIMIKRIITSFIVGAIAFSASAQVGQGELRGKVKDAKSGEALPFANVVILLNGNQVAFATTDFDGKYSIKPVTPGTYVVQASYIGYDNKQYNGVIINADKATFLDVNLSEGGVDLEAFEVVEYEVPLISKDQTSSGGTLTRDEIAKMPGRDAASVAATVGGVFSQDDGSGNLNIRGSRGDASNTFIDGVRVRGSSRLPQSAISEVKVVTGGVPANYGDATGGVVSITTRGPSREYFGGVELLTSGVPINGKSYGLDAYGFNLLGFNVAGPLLMKKDTSGKKTDPLLGFFLSGELFYDLDPRPSAIGDWKIRDSVLTSITENPLRPSGLGSGSFRNAEFLHTDDFENVKARQNVQRKGLNLQAKIDVKTTENINLTFGGTYLFNDGNQYIRSTNGATGAYSLMNYENNPQRIDQDWRVYGRFTQRFANSTDNNDEDASTIKNAYVSFQLDYTKSKTTIQNSRFKDDFAAYGYVGRFYSEFENSYEYRSNYELPDGSIRSGWFHNGFDQVSYLYEHDSINNPYLSNYNKIYYDLYKDENGNLIIPGNYETAIDVEQGGGILNGAAPRNIYDMWSTPGTIRNQYFKDDNSQFRVTASGSADINNHAIQIGFEYEQRNDKFYSLSPNSLWTVGRNIVNSHIEQLDESQYTIIYTNGNNFYYDFERLYDGESQSEFSKNIREKLGLDVDGTDWIDFDSYGKDLWEVNDFSADELLNNNVVDYAGFDHAGNKIKGNPTIDDYFSKTDENGVFSRNVPAFQPIYTAAYIQDKFSFDDLIFNVGVRIDRFDANQPVLKDPYSLFPTKTAGEVEFEHPSNIGSDYVVYVGDVDNPGTDNIVGYRNGDTWYNSQGQELSGPSTLETAKGITPWLLDPTRKNTQTDLSSEAFEDYKPQINVMPRIAFSFPISDEALFFAHYDILTQRPPSRNRLNVIDYQYITSRNVVHNNPNLKPQTTIDYELGFQQKLNSNSSLKIAAFYREMRNQVQVTQVVGAYPVTYRTFGNKDFGTIKGTTVAYDLRRIKNVWLKASYTLQFASGTGSGDLSALNLINSGDPNLRAIFPLDIDQRHAIQIVGDYRYASGKNYNGPKLFGKDILENTGLNITSRAGSGTPYTKRDRVIGTRLFTSTANSVEGSINGSNLPWTFTMDARLDRDFEVYFGKEKEGEERKSAALNVYFQILNVLNTQNVINVYSATGDPNDDGFLQEATYQSQINSQLDVQAFKDLYTIKMAEPTMYALPRRIRLGVMLNF